MHKVSLGGDRLVLGVQAQGTGPPWVQTVPVHTRVQGAMLTVAPGPKVPSCATAVLLQASRACLLCCFGHGSAPTHLIFLPRSSHT